MKSMVWGVMAGVVSLGGVVACSTSNAPAGVKSGPAASGADVKPLQEGDQAPTPTIRGVDEQPIEMARLFEQAPTVLIFYRGGWCPYCNTHLGQIAEAEAQLKQMGYQVVAISPDRPEVLQTSIDKHHLTYQLLSDSDMALCQAFGLAFRVDDATIEQYRGYGIDLEKSSGRSHHLLPVPAVYIVDQSGTIRFAYWNADYKTRLQAPSY